MQSFRRESPNNEVPPWTVNADIWYSERKVDMKDDIPKWCAAGNYSWVGARVGGTPVCRDNTRRVACSLPVMHAKGSEAWGI